MSTMPEMAPDVVEGFQATLDELRRNEPEILRLWRRGRLPFLLVSGKPSKQLRIVLRQFGWRPGMRVCGQPMDALSLFRHQPSGKNPLCMICVEPVAVGLWELTGGIWHIASYPPA
jgi:hypothetical protein